MILTGLEIDGLRSLSNVAVEPHRSLNLISGSNGAGKSSVLEAIHCLSTGHSFRTRRPRELIGTMGDGYSVTARLLEPRTETTHRIGLSRSRDGTSEMRLDYEPVDSIARATRLLPVKALTPDSHALIQDGPEERRRFIDWGVFHVEPRFLASWRMFRRSLLQRNQALRDQRPDGEVTSWDAQLADAGEQLHAYRKAYAEKLASALAPRLARLSRPLPIQLTYRSGWAAGSDLLALYADHLLQHRRMRTTTEGPHRAELAITADGLPAKQILSRGEQKMVVYLLHLAQLDLIAAEGQADTVLLCDDLLSELDDSNARQLLEHLLSTDGQIFVTGINVGTLKARDHHVFHVEQGTVSCLA